MGEGLKRAFAAARATRRTPKEGETAAQHDRPGQLEEESNAWWAMFIEHWAARGADRAKLNAAVKGFREAQRSLSEALRK